MQLTTRRPVLVPKVVRQADGQFSLLAPALGLWRGRPAIGTPITPGMSLGALEVLGQLYPMKTPEGVSGLCCELGSELDDTKARVPVTFGATLLTVDPKAASLGGAASTEQNNEKLDGTGLRAPSSGRFYRRAAPSKPFFVEVGQEISEGQVVGLLEVMKSFHRIAYTGPGLPSPARVVAIDVADGDDVRLGELLIRVEAV
ncbi:MAG: biotin/lipoyl-containing protein [Nannocystaceae bacterium]